MKNILITGCAGFIGYHLTQRLLAEGNKVTGLDNLYRDVNIDFKMTRLKALLEEGLKFHEIDLVNADATRQLFEAEKFESIIHLAARTGVRSSLENPVDYINANITGFSNLCEAAKHQKPHLIYASSSSVYGNNEVYPFSERHLTDEPVSIYAATKKSSELLAYYYADNFGMHLTGLRFFTVYGPWNRKDMAVYLFMDAISQNRPIRLFNHGEMKRDFTYVDDITESIYRLINKEKFVQNTLPQNTVYNIGFGQPVTLEKLVSTIEINLGKKAIIQYADLQPGDMVNTWADNSVLSNLIGFKPKVSIEEGIRLTAQWYKGLNQD